MKMVKASACLKHGHEVSTSGLTIRNAGEQFGYLLTVSGARIRANDKHPALCKFGKGVEDFPSFKNQLSKCWIVLTGSNRAGFFKQFLNRVRYVPNPDETATFSQRDKQIDLRHQIRKACVLVSDCGRPAPHFALALMLTLNPRHANGDQDSHDGSNSLDPRGHIRRGRAGLPRQSTKPDGNYQREKKQVNVVPLSAAFGINGIPQFHNCASCPDKGTIVARRYAPSQRGAA